MGLRRFPARTRSRLTALACAVAFSLPAPGATLIHRYVFEGGVTDLVGTENGALLGGASANGGLLVLDGADDYVQFGAHLVPSGSYSVVFQAVGPAEVTSYFEMISQQGARGWYIGAEPNLGDIRAGDDWMDTGVLFPTDGLMHEYALVVDDGANTSKLFIDGLLRNTLSSAIAVDETGTGTRLGRQYGSYGEYFGGAMADVRIYSGALSDQEIAGVPEPSAWLLCAGCLLFCADRYFFRRRPS